jgi:predicted AlkP superfamily phosphohydrolase/phosphomutase
MVNINNFKEFNNENKKVVVFGIDGATWEIINYLTKQNKLPNFRKIMKDGVFGNLKSTNPPVTCPAWATLFTGKSPARLGVYYFFKVTPDYNLKLVKLNWRKWRPIWDIFSDYEKNVFVCNIPTTIAKPINGYFISGPIWGEDEKLIAYPQDLNEKLKNNGYSIRTNVKKKIVGDDKFIKEIQNLTENKFNVIFDFYKNFKWDLFIFGFYYCDQLQHIYWKDIYKKHPKYSENSKFNNVIFDHYKSLDSILGKILDALPKNTTIIILSDHGHAGVHTHINLNAWLHKQGLINLKQNQQKVKQGKIKTNLRNKFLKIFYLLANFNFKITNKNIFQTLKLNLHFQKKFKKIFKFFNEQKFQKEIFKDYIDWENTQAFNLIFNTIFLNVKDRQLNGKIPKEKINKFRDNIINELKELKDPKTDKKVIKNIWTLDEIYPGIKYNDFPDIYLEFNEGYRNYTYYFDNSTKIFSKDFDGSTEHSLNGIFLAYGPEIKKGEKIIPIDLEDIVPTILHHFNYPINKDIDGRVVSDIFKSTSESGLREVRRESISELEKLHRNRIQQIHFSKKI